MAVGGARGIAVGAAAAAVVAGCGGSNPGTSQDQRPRMSAIGAAAAGNPRSRGGLGEGRGGKAGPRRRRWWWTEEGDARLYSIYRFEWGRERRTGARNFSALAFRFVPSPCFVRVTPPRPMVVVGAFQHRFLAVFGCFEKKICDEIL